MNYFYKQGFIRKCAEYNGDGVMYNANNNMISKNNK